MYVLRIESQDFRVPIIRKQFVIFDLDGCQRPLQADLGVHQVLVVMVSQR
jgi:hypothetical protein